MLKKIFIAIAIQMKHIVVYFSPPFPHGPRFHYCFIFSSFKSQNSSFYSRWYPTPPNLATACCTKLYQRHAMAIVLLICRKWCPAKSRFNKIENAKMRGRGQCDSLLGSMWEITSQHKHNFILPCEATKTHENYWSCCTFLDTGAWYALQKHTFLCALWSTQGGKYQMINTFIH